MSNSENSNITDIVNEVQNAPQNDAPTGTVVSNDGQVITLGEDGANISTK